MGRIGRSGRSGLILSWICVYLRASAVSYADSPMEVLEQVRPKVVLVLVQIGRTERGGTGFIAGPSLVLTSEHVVRGARRVQVWINETAYPAEVLHADAENDLAVLLVRGGTLAIKALPLADAHSTIADERVVIVGCHPTLVGGRTPRVRQSIIPARFQRVAWFGGALKSPWGTVEVAGSVEPGDSGSPVIRLRDGAVIGVVRARNSPDQEGRSTTAWAVPIEAARGMLPDADRGPRFADRRPTRDDRPTTNDRRRPGVEAAPAEEFYLVREARRGTR
jgi:S1-C subfamily serine protease